MPPYYCLILCPSPYRSCQHVLSCCFLGGLCSDIGWLTDWRRICIDLSDICPIPWLVLAPVDTSSAWMTTPVVETINWRLSSPACTFVKIFCDLGISPFRPDSSPDSCSSVPFCKFCGAYPLSYIEYKLISGMFARGNVPVMSVIKAERSGIGLLILKSCWCQFWVVHNTI